MVYAKDRNSDYFETPMNPSRQMCAIANLFYVNKYAVALVFHICFFELFLYDQHVV